MDQQFCSFAKWPVSAYGKRTVYARTRILLGQDRQTLFFAEFALLHNHSFFGQNLTFFPFEWLRDMESVQVKG
jgi:hypothetical protein